MATKDKERAEEDKATYEASKKSAAGSDDDAGDD